MRPPDLTEIRIHYEGSQLLALCFETDRAPFMVKNPTGLGPIQFEIPWRDGTATRSAKRRELLSILMPRLEMPTAEVLSGKIAVTSNTSTNILIKVYISYTGKGELVFPHHKTLLKITDGKGIEGEADRFHCDTKTRSITDFTRMMYSAAGNNAPPVVNVDAVPDRIEITSSEVVVRAASIFYVTATFSNQLVSSLGDDISVEGVFSPLGCDWVWRFKANFSKKKIDDKTEWMFNKK